ncbi:MAG: hypothetical protein ACI9VN_001415 [Patescibacteria group bacterium]|jgi:hypothetical protein
MSVSCPDGWEPEPLLPDTYTSEILCYENSSFPDDLWDEFKGSYEGLALKGLKFIEIYDSELDS